MDDCINATKYCHNSVTFVETGDKNLKIIIVMLKKHSIDEFKYNGRISCTRVTAMVLLKCNCLIKKVRSNMIFSHCRATSYRRNYHFSTLD